MASNGPSFTKKRMLMGQKLARGATHSDQRAGGAGFRSLLLKVMDQQLKDGASQKPKPERQPRHTENTTQPGVTVDTDGLANVTDVCGKNAEQEEDKKQRPASRGRPSTASTGVERRHMIAERKSPCCEKGGQSPDSGKVGLTPTLEPFSKIAGPLQTRRVKRPSFGKTGNEEDKRSCVTKREEDGARKDRCYGDNSNERTSKHQTYMTSGTDCTELVLPARYPYLIVEGNTEGELNSDREDYLFVTHGRRIAGHEAGYFEKRQDAGSDGRRRDMRDAGKRLEAFGESRKRQEEGLQRLRSTFTEKRLPLSQTRENPGQDDPWVGDNNMQTRAGDYRILNEYTSEPPADNSRKCCEKEDDHITKYLDVDKSVSPAIKKDQRKTNSMFSGLIRWESASAADRPAHTARPRSADQNRQCRQAGGPRRVTWLDSLGRAQRPSLRADVGLTGRPRRASSVGKGSHDAPPQGMSWRADNSSAVRNKAFHQPEHDDISISPSTKPKKHGPRTQTKYSQQRQKGQVDQEPHSLYYELKFDEQNEEQKRPEHLRKQKEQRHEQYETKRKDSPHWRLAREELAHSPSSSNSPDRVSTNSRTRSPKHSTKGVHTSCTSPALSATHSPAYSVSNKSARPSTSKADLLPATVSVPKPFSHVPESTPAQRMVESPAPHRAFHKKGERLRTTNPDPDLPRSRSPRQGTRVAARGALGIARRENVSGDSEPSPEIPSPRYQTSCSRKIPPEGKTLVAEHAPVKRQGELEEIGSPTKRHPIREAKVNKEGSKGVQDWNGRGSPDTQHGEEKHRSTDSLQRTTAAWASVGEKKTSPGWKSDRSGAVKKETTGHHNREPNIIWRDKRRPYKAPVLFTEHRAQKRKDAPAADRQTLRSRSAAGKGRYSAPLYRAKDGKSPPASPGYSQEPERNSDLCGWQSDLLDMISPLDGGAALQLAAMGPEATPCCFVLSPDAPTPAFSEYYSQQHVFHEDTQCPAERPWSSCDQRAESIPGQGDDTVHSAKSPNSAALTSIPHANSNITRRHVHERDSNPLDRDKRFGRTHTERHVREDICDGVDKRGERLGTEALDSDMDGEIVSRDDSDALAYNNKIHGSNGDNLIRRDSAKFCQMPFRKRHDAALLDCTMKNDSWQSEEELEEIVCRLLESSNQMARKVVSLRENIKDLKSAKAQITTASSIGQGQSSKDMADSLHGNDAGDMFQGEDADGRSSLHDYLMLIAFMALQLLAQFVFVQQ